MVPFQYYILVFIFKTFRFRPQISWLTAVRTHQKGWHSSLLFSLCNDTQRHRSGKYIENASDKELKSVFGRNLYDTDVTNSIFEIRLTSYCPFLYTVFQPTAGHEWLEWE